MDTNGTRGWTFQVQAWHVVLLLVIQLLGLGIAYGRIEQNQEDTEKQLIEIKGRDVVTRGDWDAWRLEILTQINRLELKIDKQYISR